MDRRGRARSFRRAASQGVEVETRWVRCGLEIFFYFAGEAHDVNRQMGVPGAVLSGLNAVDQLLTDATAPDRRE